MLPTTRRLTAADDEAARRLARDVRDAVDALDALDFEDVPVGPDGCPIVTRPAVTL